MIEAFWQQCQGTLPATHPHRAKAYTAWEGGDNSALMDGLGQLVAQVTKTATTSLLWEYAHDGESIPEVGELSIILSGAGLPLRVIETTEVRVMPFDQVDEQFAYDEGDRTLAYWRDAHRRFFGRVCARIGRTVADDMLVVCERFRLVYKA
jgi:uncharacterized protein YhfF